MKSAVRTLLAVVAGMALAFALVVAVEFFSAVVHPFPAKLRRNIPEHVRRYPDWVLAGRGADVGWRPPLPLPGWRRESGGRLAGAIVTLLLASALAFNLSMLPYVMWFKMSRWPAAFLRRLPAWHQVRRAGAPRPRGPGRQAS